MVQFTTLYYLNIFHTVHKKQLFFVNNTGRMEVDGMMAEAGAEVAPEAGAPEAGAEVAPEAGASEAGADASEPPSEPPSEPLADEQYEAGADVMDDVDEVEEGKVQHVHGAAHEPQLHGVHAQVPPRRSQVVVQDDGRSGDMVIVYGIILSR
jgi:hypothetical protein